MPHTLTALETGQLNEWRATLLARETACLTPADRAAVDDELAPDTGTLDGAGDRALIAAARAAAYRRDPRSLTQRAAHAATDRHVSFRPAPDTMCTLTALLPVSAGVAVQAALTRAADTLRTAGTPAAAARPWPTPSSNAPPAPPAESAASNSSSSSPTAPCSRPTPNRPGSPATAPSPPPGHEPS